MTTTAYDCQICGQRIGAQRTHYITETNHVCCGGCVFNEKTTTPAHAQLYQNCEIAWHDLWDHQFMHAPSRASAQRWLNARDRRP